MWCWALSSTSDLLLARHFPLGWCAYITSCHSVCASSAQVGWPPAYMLGAVTDNLWSAILPLVAIGLPSRSTVWCFCVIMSATWTLVFLRMRPLHYGDSTDQLLSFYRHSLRLKLLGFPIFDHMLYRCLALWLTLRNLVHGTSRTRFEKT